MNQRGPGFPPLSRNELFGSALTKLIEEFKRLKYHVVFGVLNAADFGVPQKRCRVVFIGSRDGEPIQLPSPTHSEHPSAELHLLPWMTLRAALKNVLSENWYEFSETRKTYLRKLKPGQNWRHLKDKRVQRKALGAAFLSWGGRTGFYRRLAWDQPSPTLTMQPDSFATMLCHELAAGVSTAMVDVQGAQAKTSSQLKELTKDYVQLTAAAKVQVEALKEAYFELGDSAASGSETALERLAQQEQALAETKAQAVALRQEIKELAAEQANSGTVTGLGSASEQLAQAAAADQLAASTLKSSNALGMLAKSETDSVAAH